MPVIPTGRLGFFIGAFLFGFARWRGFTYELKMTDVQQLLSDYAKAGSEASFRELVERYIKLVYSTALRLTGGDTQLAEDVVQTVFINLARKARTLSGDVMLGGWLHQHTYHVATKAMRAERRRQSREREAVEMKTLHDDSAADWQRLAPTLDEAITQLGTEDRNAILLRFFEERDFRSVGAALGRTEDAARMRVARALEKLHSILKRRGVTLSAAALGSALASEALTAAPAGLAVSVAGAAFAGSSVSAGGLVSVLKLMTMTKLKASIISAGVLVGLLTPLVLQHEAGVRLREENRSLREQLARIATDNQALSNRVVFAPRAPSPNNERLRELLRLRGQVGVLRRQLREIEQAATALPATRPDGLSPRAPQATPESNNSAPFQLQLVLDRPSEDSTTITNGASGDGGETLHVQKRPLMDYTAVRAATVTRDPQNGAPRIDLEFNEVGKDLFAGVTRENVNSRLAIVLDGHLYAAPVIREAISGGKAQITGSFTEEEAKALAAKINGAVSGMADDGKP